MFPIENLTSDPLQTMTLILPDGSQANLTIAFYPQQYAWFLVSLTWKTFVLQGVQITTNPNMLHQYINQLNFGLGCFTTANREPTQQQDFESGAAQLFILSQAETLAYAAFLSAGVFV